MKALRWNNKIRGKVEIKLYLCVACDADEKFEMVDMAGFRAIFPFFFLLSIEGLSTGCCGEIYF